MTETITVMTDTTIENYFNFCLEIKKIVVINRFKKTKTIFIGN